MVIAYHGTDSARMILANGFSNIVARKRDPGDFGWGVYFTTDYDRADRHGESVIKVGIDMYRMALIDNPYFSESGHDTLPLTATEKLFYDAVFVRTAHSRTMTTCCGEWENRIAAAKRVRQVFLANGFTGITTRREDRETVVFDTSTITVLGTGR